MTALTRPPGTDDRYWDQARETMPLAHRQAAVLARVQHQLNYAYHRLPLYRRLYEQAGFHPDQVRTMADFTARVPVITKDVIRADQLEHPPFGSYSGIEPTDIARIYGSSGTTGRPTLYGISRDDWTRARSAQAMALWAMGVRPSDRVHFVFPFGMFIGGWALLLGSEAVGATAFTAGAMDTERQIDMMLMVKPTVLTGTPSYCLHLGEVAARIGADLREAGLRVVIVGGEPGGSLEACREQIRAVFGPVVVCDSGNTSECFPTQMNSSCTEQAGVHIFEDEVFCEIVDPTDSTRTVPDGRSGATVYTTLWRTSQPMIRFWSGDEAALTYDPCRCGRTYPRFPTGVTGRIDDMLLIRGANVYPSTIDEALRKVSGLGAEYRIVVDKIGALDELTLQVEPQPELAGQDGFAETFRSEIADRMRTTIGLRCAVELVEPGYLERQVFKARRVIDRRPRIAPAPTQPVASPAQAGVANGH